MDKGESFMSEVRVRFAPSPTGALHVGSARTALFNWLFARNQGGKFVLRIEDTDLARSTQESVEGILEGMRWLGLDWDEGPGADAGEYGPYFQSQRLELYQKYIDLLLEQDKAYLCYCTADELDAMRKEQMAKGEAPKYNRKCACLSADDREKFAAEGRTAVVRFRSTDEGRTKVADLIRGDVYFDNEVLDDFVIRKSDGMPTYNFAVVIDDALMRITHVIRGEDHLSNTPRQIQVYEALGFAAPEFAHIPMILGPDKTKLSKRHGATSVTQYREDGFLPEAIMNYLALLGWSYNATQNIFSRDELVEKFSLAKCTKNPAVFDIKKLEWMNGVYLRELSAAELTQRAVPLLIAAGLIDKAEAEAQEERIKTIMAALQTRLHSLVDVVDSSRYFFTDDFTYDEKAVKKFLGRPYAVKLFGLLLTGLEAVESWSQESIEAVFKSVQQELDEKLGNVIQPVRVAVTGGTVSPGMYEVLELLDKELSLKRLRKGLEMAQQQAKQE